MYMDEPGRLAALACLDLVGEESEAFFQRIGRMAVRYFDFPAVMITFIDAEQEWFKAGVGFEAQSLPRTLAFGDAVLAAGQAVFVEDTLENDRFFDHPLVVDAPNVRAYFAVPIFSPTGHIVGTLALIDYQPRRLTSDDLVFLEDLSAIIENELNRLSTCASYESVENQLLRYSERFKKSLNYANVGSWDWNLKTSDVFLTEQVSMLLGYPEADMRVSYKSFLDSIHPADRKPVLAQIRDSIVEGSEFDIDFRIVKPDGEQRWMHTKGDVFTDETGEPERVLGIIVDIHERKKLELDFLENELKFRNLYENAPIGLALNNFKGRFLAANHALLEMLGYSEPELKDLSYWDITPESYQAQELELLEQLGEQRQYGPYEKEYIRKDGSVLRVRLNGVLIQEPNDEPLIWSFIEDITDAKQAEQAVKEAHNRLLEAQKLANMGSWQANMATGELHWSETIYDIFGFDKEGFSPSVEAFKNAIHPEDVALVEQSEKKAEITGVHDVVHRIIRPDGEVRYVHELAQLVESESGKKDLLSGTVQDVTELKRVESSLRIFQRIFCASQQGMGITDKDGFLLYTNRAHDEIHGYEHGETVGMHITKFFSSENRDWIMERVGRCIEEGEGWTGLLPIVQKNGKPVVTSANVNVIMDG
ncbi:MAG: PAS domain S-box protein, partial [Hydrogenovibrio sp.]|nr:PAS domain S-box protein [Hydrogenovibrio sp.]